MGDLRSLLPAEVAIASGLWAPQTRSWLGLSYDEHRPGSHRQTEHRVLARPLGRSIAQTGDADAAPQTRAATARLFSVIGRPRRASHI